MYFTGKTRFYKQNGTLLLLYWSRYVITYKYASEREGRELETSYKRLVSGPLVHECLGRCEEHRVGLVELTQETINNPLHHCVVDNMTIVVPIQVNKLIDI